VASDGVMATKNFIKICQRVLKSIFILFVVHFSTEYKSEISTTDLQLFQD
jgi:hypothetical protein